DNDGDARYLIRDIVLRDDGDVDPNATGGSGMIFGSVGGLEIRSVAFQDAAFTNGIVFDALAGAEVGIFDSTIRSDDDGISVKSLAGNSQAQIACITIDSVGGAGIAFLALVSSSGV